MLLLCDLALIAMLAKLNQCLFILAIVAGLFASVFICELIANFVFLLMQLVFTALRAAKGRNFNLISFFQTSKPTLYPLIHTFV